MLALADVLDTDGRERTVLVLAAAGLVAASVLAFTGCAGSVKFWRLLLVVVCVAFGVRVAYVALAKSESCPVDALGVHGSYPSECALGDQLFYNTAADRLAAGDGFVEPLWNVTHPGEPSPPAADHPPLTVLVLAPVSWLVERPPLAWIAGDDLDANVREHRYTMVLLGTRCRRVDRPARPPGRRRRRRSRRRGHRRGQSEHLGERRPRHVGDGHEPDGRRRVAARVRRIRPPVAATVRGVGRDVRVGRARARRAAALRPVARASRSRGRRGRDWPALGAAVGASVLVVAPWVVYNLTRFDEPVFLSTNDGLALSGSNCDPVYYGAGTGLTSFDTTARCVDVPPPPGDQSDVAKVYRSRAFDYVRDHLGRAPSWRSPRVGRTWSLFRPLDMVDFNTGEGRERWVTRLGLAFFYPTLVAAAAGAVLLWRRRRRARCWVLLVPVVTVTRRERVHVRSDPVPRRRRAVARGARRDRGRHARAWAARRGRARCSVPEPARV